MKMAVFFGSLGEDRSPEEAEVGGSYEPHRLQGHVFLALGDGISVRSLHIFTWIKSKCGALAGREDGEVLGR